MMLNFAKNIFVKCCRGCLSGNIKTYIYAVTSGVLLAVSFNFPAVWFVSFVALVPLLLVIYDQTLTSKKVFFLGWLFGAVLIGTALSSFWEALPLEWMGFVNRAMGALFVFFYWGSFTLVLSFFIGLWTLAAKTITRRNFVDVALLSGLWVLFEYLRMWGFALLTLGPGSLFEPHFSIVFLGYILAPSEILLQFARLGGVYMLSFVLVVSNVALYHLFLTISQRELQFKKTSVVAVFLLFLIFASTPLGVLFPIKENDAETLSVAVLNTYFPATLSFSKEEDVRRIEQGKQFISKISSEAENTDIIIFPEDSRFLTSLMARNELRPFAEASFFGKEKLIIDSGRVETPDGKTYFRVFYYTTQKDSLQISEKRFLVPGGEYMPYVYRSLFKIFGQGNTLSKIDKNRAYAKGGQKGVGTFKNITFGSLFCSELLSPSLYASLVGQHGADILVNVSSQSWFHGSRVLYRQTKNVAKVRAVENNRPLIQASNGTPSFVIDRYGRLVAESAWGNSSVLYADIPIL